MIVTEGPEHFIPDCPVYREIRQPSIIFRRPHIENGQQVLSGFLHNSETIPKNKDILYNMWKKETGK